jgi:hypothetical protein
MGWNFALYASYPLNSWKSIQLVKRQLRKIEAREKS